MGLFGSDPQLVTDGEIYGKVREIITGAQKQLLLISPYIDPTGDFVRQLEAAAAQRQVDVRLVFRKDRLSEYRGKDWFHRLEAAGVTLSVIERLHSKVYLNEKTAIVTSMNFYSSSGENSFEAGVLFEDDHKLMDKLKEYVASLQRHFEDASLGRPAPRQRTSPPRTGASARPVLQGHCIRCGGTIPLNPMRPYCGSDYDKWARYKNEDYADEHCHGCGRAYPATMRKPLCHD
ncbi:MAG TPA: phospholipase D-like domain-containing protein, partial [Hyalangium sp.]|nr:phospholipase D-like domain-containing protein [Hyalangium sp.]